MTVLRSDMLRAELRVLELEEAFRAAKESGEVTAEQRHELRQARAEFRRLREDQPAEDGVARPAAVSSKSAVTGNGA